MQFSVARAFKIFKLNTINKKFLYAVIIPFIIVVLVSTLINVSMNTAQGEEDIAAKAETVTKLASLSLVDPLWNYNNDVLKNGVDSLFSDKEVYSVVVRDQDGNEKIKKTSDNKSLEKAENVLVKADIKHEKDKIGSIELKMTKYYLDKKVGNEILVSSINNIAIIIILIVIIALVSKIVVKPLKELMTTAVKISEGNYNYRSNVYSDDETGILSTHFNKMADNICDVMTKLKTTGASLETNISKLKDTSVIITKISAEVYNSSGEMASTAQELNATIEEISSNASVISQVVSEVSSAAAETSIKSNRITEITADGKIIVNETISKINSVAKAFEEIESKVRMLNQRSAEIKNFTNIIETIASQTSLISLNAAIEAARAGEFGKGFAVVADEIRKLSEQSSVATRQINQLISDIDKGIEETVHSTAKGSVEVKGGVELTTKAGESLDRISEAIDGIIRFIRDIEQKSRSADDGVRGVAKSCEDFATAVEHVSLSAQELSKTAERMYQTAAENDASGAGL